MSKIYILCPGNIISGGVNSLHNLCHSLDSSGYQTFMVYVDRKQEIVENNVIKSFQTKESFIIEDLSENCIVVPETMTQYITHYKHCKKIVYWLSIKFYFKNPTYRFPFTIKLFRKLISCTSYFGYPDTYMQRLKRKLSIWNKKNDEVWNPNTFHIVNSYYTLDFLQSIGIDKVHLLHNPIRKEFYTHPINPERKNQILFGPKTTQYLTNLYSKKFPDYKCIRIKRIAPQKVTELYRESLLFIELSHSGRDRMPREALMSGCVVLTGNIGSAAYIEDLQLPEFYKIDVTKPYRKVLLKKINEIITNYSIHYENMQQLKEYLVSEDLNFEQNTRNIFEKIMGSE